MPATSPPSSSVPARSVLADGTRLAVVELPWAESVCFGICIGIGARHDPARCGGLAHFAEHLFFKGTRRHNSRDLNLAIESVGGNADAFTSEEHTCFYVRGPAEQFEHFAEILLEMFLTSTFPAEEVEKEREVISEEISMYLEQPASRAEDLLCLTMWPDHPLGRPISGDEASLRRIRRQDLVDHARQFYVRRNTVLAVAGNINPEKVRRVLQKLLSRRFRDGRRPFTRPRPAAGFRAGPRLAFERRAVEQTQIALAFHAPGRNRINAHALKLLNVLAGENTSSHLWHELRDKRGWCYQIDSETLTLSDAGLFQVFAGVDPANASRALALIWDVLRGFVENPVTERDLHRAVAYSQGAARMGLESTANQMLWIAESLLFHDEIIPMRESFRRFEKVTPQQIQGLARRIFHPAKMGVAAVGPQAPELPPKS